METLYRPATLADATAIAMLMPDLGYEASAADLVRRLGVLLDDASHAVFVADAGGTLRGACHVATVRHLASDGFAEVLDLVVAAAHQGQGHGRALLQCAERWAAAAGHTRVRLRSGVHREAAHAFCERQGYERSRASFAFERRIQAAAACSSGR